MNFHLIWNNLKKHKTNDFLITTDYQLNNGDLINFVGSWIAFFDQCEVSPTNRIVILTQNEVAAITCFIASLLDGLVPVMLSPETPEHRVLSIINSIEPTLILIDENRQQESWIKQTSGCFNVKVLGATKRTGLFNIGSKRNAIKNCGLDLPSMTREPRLPEINDELAYLLFTSGTTQNPSGVMISRKNIIANLQTLSRLFDCTPSSRLFNDMVLAHADGLVLGPLLALANSATLIRSGGISLNNIENWLNRVRQQRATHFFTVPTVWSFIDNYAAHNDYFESNECMYLISGAAKLDNDLWLRLQNRFGKDITNQYGLTETVACALYSGNSHPEVGAFGTTGKPVDCEARIGKIDANSEIGELQLRGDNIFSGYWKNLKRTSEAFTKDGWMKTGDIVQICPDNSYQVVGRLKTIINSGGFLIRPEEIDEVLLGHSSVIESVTVSITDTTFDEIPVTAVVLKDSDVSENDLLEHARSNLEPLKVPKRVIYLPSIPRGGAGKPKLNELKEKIQKILDNSNNYTGERNSDHSKEVYRVAAETLHVDLKMLNSSSNPKSIQSWDSFSHVALIVAMEDHFSIRLPVAKASSIRNLGDLVSAINGLLK